MDEAQYLKWKKKIERSYQKFTGDQQGAEDCAQEVITKWLEKGGRLGQTVDQAVIDYLRISTGRKGSSGYESRRAMASATDIDEEREHGAGGDFETDHINDRTKALGAKERHIIELIRSGHTFKEIGERFGVTESRVSQWVTGMRSKVSEGEEKAELLVMRSLDDDARKFLKRIMNGAAK